MPDEVIRDPRTPNEIIDLQTYQRLARIERTKGRLTSSEAKAMNRARSRLLKANVIRPMTRSSLEAVARNVYRDMPWYQKLRMRIKYEWRRLRKRMGR